MTYYFQIRPPTYACTLSWRTLILENSHYILAQEGKSESHIHPPPYPAPACLGPGSRRNDSHSVRPLGLSEEASAHSCASHTVGSCISSFVFQCLPHGEPTVAVPVVWAPHGIFCMWLNQRKSRCPELSRMTFASDIALVQLSSNSS